MAVASIYGFLRSVVRYGQDNEVDAQNQILARSSYSQAYSRRATQSSHREVSAEPGYTFVGCLSL